MATALVACEDLIEKKKSNMKLTRKFIFIFIGSIFILLLITQMF